MSFLKQGGSIIGMEIMAEKYCSGKPFGNPFLGSIDGISG